MQPCATALFSFFRQFQPVSLFVAGEPFFVAFSLLGLCLLRLWISELVVVERFGFEVTFRTGTAIMPIKLVMGGVPFTVDEEKMPYFKAWASFKELQSPDAGDAPYHAPLEFFAAAHVGVEKGFRFIFRDTSLASELENYKRLVDTMKLLCIGVTNGLSLDNIIKKLKIITERDKHDTYCIRRGRIQDAQDAAFLFLWAILEGGTEMAPHRMANKIQVAVVFVMSHPKSFHFVIRRVLEAAYNSRFVSTPKQILQMNKWHDTTDSDCNYQSTDSNEEEGGYDSDGYYS